MQYNIYYFSDAPQGIFVSLALVSMYPTLCYTGQLEPFANFAGECILSTKARI